MRIGANGAACSMASSPARRSSSSARNADACSSRVSSATSVSKSNLVRRRRSERNRSRNCATGGKRNAMCDRETSGGSCASSRSTRANDSGSCCASGISTFGASGAGPSRKKRTPSGASRSPSTAAASFARRYSARRRASSSAASSGSSSASSAFSSGKSPRAFSSSSEAMRTRNSPHASRSSSSLSASRSRKAVTMPARSTSRRSSSSLRTSASSRSNGPSNASRSSSSSRTITAGTLVPLPDAALRDGHARPLRHRAGLGDCRLLRARAEELPPDEERDRQDPDPERDPEVDPLAREVVGRVDAQDFLVRAEGRVPGDVEREQRGPAQREAPVDPEEDADADQVPRELVEERRVEGREPLVAAHAMGGIDLQRPRKLRGLAVELLVPVVPPPADPLGEEQTGRDRVHHQPDAVARVAHDQRAGEN